MKRQQTKKLITKVLSIVLTAIMLVNINLPVFAQWTPADKKVMQIADSLKNMADEYEKLQRQQEMLLKHIEELERTAELQRAKANAYKKLEEAPDTKREKRMNISRNLYIGGVGAMFAALILYILPSVVETAPIWLETLSTIVFSGGMLALVGAGLFTLFSSAVPVPEEISTYHIKDFKGTPDTERNDPKFVRDVLFKHPEYFGQREKYNKDIPVVNPRRLYEAELKYPELKTYRENYAFYLKLMNMDTNDERLVKALLTTVEEYGKTHQPDEKTAQELKKFMEGGKLRQIVQSGEGRKLQEKILALQDFPQLYAAVRKNCGPIVKELEYKKELQKELQRKMMKFNFSNPQDSGFEEYKTRIGLLAP
ncbi:MAG: hypothetical protein LBL61_04415 [Elusimicrobiota bacterium]|jgi:hypothetical protein|nr:hypothetical protein [Elusimicrobiota bacterium]